MPLAALARWPKASIDGPSGSPPQSQAKDAQASTYACGPITPNSGKPNFAYGAYNDSSAVLGDNFQAYDDFTVPVGQSWKITSIFANIGDPAYSTSLAANWFVRTGMTATSLGTLAATGLRIPEFFVVSQDAINCSTAAAGR